MFDFKHTHPAVNLTPEWILSKISEESIFRYYFNESITLGKAYCSIFSRDKNPSTWFFRNAHGKLVYYDCRTGEKWDCFGLVKKKYGLNFQQALKQIASDFGLIDKTTIKVSPKIIKEANEMDKENKAKSLIQFIPDKWQDKHLKWWKQYEITKEELESENVYPVKKLFLNKNEIYNPNNHLRFAYPEQYPDENGKFKTGVKVYSPNDKNIKWMSSIPLHVPFGWNSIIPTSERIIITKSKKDLIVLKKWFPDVIAVQNESEAALPEQIQSKILMLWKIACINYDADPVGVENCTKFNAKGFTYFNTPKADYIKYGIKDVSDYIRIYGKDLLEQLFKQYNLL